MELNYSDATYLQAKEARSAIFVNYKEEIRNLKGYADYIKTLRFAHALIILLNINKKDEFIDEEVKDNIRDVLLYIRFNTPDFSSEHNDLLNEAIWLINTTPNSKGSNSFYKKEYLMRNMGFYPYTKSQYLLWWEKVLINNSKEIIRKSISKETDILSNLLYQKEENFLNENIEEYMFNTYFIDTINEVLTENPHLFAYPHFKERTLNILKSTLNAVPKTFLIYEQSNPEINLLTITRTRNTIKRITSLQNY